MQTFRITELGKRFGLSRSTLLYYDRIGLLSPGGRSRAGYRAYTQDDLSRLERICLFREAGVSLTEIAALLDGDGDGDSILERRLRDIGNEIVSLKTQQRLLAGMLKTVASGRETSGLDQDQWLRLQRACGLDEEALKRWHNEFERAAPAAHHEFLAKLGLGEKEVVQIRMLTRSVESNTKAMEYFFELFEDLPRQAPGCKEATLRALAAIDGLPSNPAVLDIGCGSGAPSLILARELGAKVLAIDNHRPMLERLDRTAAREGLDIETRELSMFEMPFEDRSFDLVWAEGSLFILGLERALMEIGRLLKPGGFLAFTELCWFTDDPPTDAKEYFERAYPDIRATDQVRCLARDSGYEVVLDFRLPDSAWWDDYYTPMLARMETLRAVNAGVPEAEAVYAARQAEVEMFWHHSKCYGYAFFVLRKERRS